MLELHKNKVKNIVTIEENALYGGFGAAILETCNELNVYFNIKRFGLPDEFVTYGNKGKYCKAIMEFPK